ncbi:sigma-70 family RNA polymerase sigma factor [Streptomyces sp. IGB124]|uniref:sigma-70 family RNA polymerase sigma factor n=1 Tax=Streptomyces sp. IGB124 TaxID=1519485 RepID=UPI00131AFA26|nr:sigma-70 family RNA polymerase sigma factor [Streptomyces sp. IGB124]
MTQKPSEAAPLDDEVEALLAELRPRLIREALYATQGDGHLSEDLAQAVLERISKKIAKGELSAPNNLGAYARKTITNAFLDDYRRKKPVVFVAEAPDVCDRPPISLIDSVGDEIIAMVSDLPPKQRQVIICCVLMNIAPEDVAERLVLSVETVKRYQRLGIKNLQKMVTSPKEVSA